MNIEIKLLNQSEIGSFYKIFCEVLSEEFPGYKPEVIKYFLEKIYTPLSFHYWLDHNLKTILVAKEANEIYGFAVIDEPYGGVSLCRWLGVLKEHQHKGIGSKLIAEWIETAKKQGCHKVEVAAQPEAKEFYEKQELKLEGKRLLSYFGIDQYLFGKVLGTPNMSTMISH